MRYLRMAVEQFSRKEVRQFVQVPGLQALKMAMTHVRPTSILAEIISVVCSVTLGGGSSF